MARARGKDSCRDHEKNNCWRSLSSQHVGMSFGSDSLENRTIGFVADQVFAKVDEGGIDSLSDVERALYVAFNIDTGIASESVYAIFHHMPQLLPYGVEALETVGLSEQAAAFTAILDLLPAPAEDEADRFDQVMAIQKDDPERDERIQDLDAIFDSDLADKAFYRFIQQHESEFLPR